VGLVYVAFVIDAFARRIVGWRVSRTAQASFVLDALVSTSSPWWRYSNYLASGKPGAVQ
jgi:transposase InsO family protein